MMGTTAATIPPTITLPGGGVELPRVGLGTFKAGSTELRAAVGAALAAGIRHIDTASIYKNEADVAAALWDDARAPRDSVFITSKISPYEMGAHKAAAATDAILQRLRVDYVDLLLVHWPGGKGVPADSPRNAALRAETWRVLEAARAAGKARAIGVSNFEPRHLAELPPAAAGGPAVNQIEVHPRWPARALREACDSRGAAVVAYSPLGCGHLVNDPTVLRIAAALGRTPAQVLLRYGLEKGCAVIPKSVRPERVCEFAPQNVLDGWRLGVEHTALLDALVDDDAGSIKYCWDPSGIK